MNACDLDAEPALAPQKVGVEVALDVPVACCVTSFDKCTVSPDCTIMDCGSSPLGHGRVSQVLPIIMAVPA